MKLKNYFLLFFLLASFVSSGQTFSDTQQGTAPVINFTELPNCIDNASLQITEFTNLDFSFSDCQSGDIDYNVLVNGTNIGSCSLTGTNIDLSSYIPLTSLSISTVLNDFSDTLRLSATLTLSVSSPSPSVTNVNYMVGDTAVALTATGTGLLWYTTETGGTGSSTAPVPSTVNEGVFEYWVSQTVSSCESSRAKILVYVLDENSTGKSLHFDGVDDHVLVSNFDYSVSNNFTLDFWVKPEKTITLPAEGTSGITGSSNQSYPLFPTLISLYTPLDNNTHAMAGVSVGTNGIGVFEHNGGYLPCLLAYDVTITDWTRVTVVYTNKQPSLYINGVFVKTGLTSLKSFVHPTTRDFGTSDNVTHATYGPFEGLLDRVYILNESVIPNASCEPDSYGANVLAFYNFNQGTASGNNANIDFLYENNGVYIGELIDFNLTGSSSNWLADEPNNSTITPNIPTVSTPVVYNQNDVATALTATTGTNGTGLLWYTVETGGTGTTTAPTPSTTTAGNTSYWVSSTNANGCESERVEIVVTVNAVIPATHLNFDGSNDVINLGSNLTTSFTGKTAFTLEAWVKPETTTGLGVIVGNYDYPSAGLGMQMLLRKENSNYTLWMDNGTGFVNITQPNTVVLNTWQHIAGTWDGSVLSLYIDGVLVNSSNVSGTLPSKSTTFSIGSNGHNEAFNGAIDEVRIWDVTRTVSQINSSKNCELQGDESGLVSYFKFNQGSDQANNTSETTLSNSVSGAANGTLTNFTLTGATSNWLAGSPVTSGSTIPGVPTVSTPVVYNQNDAATALTATTGTNGTGLLWYTVATGGTGTATAPTPSTTTVGSTSYWVSSTNANGCESERVEIVVTVNALIPATHLNFDGANDFVSVASPFTGYTNEITVDFWIKRKGNLTTGSGLGQSTPNTDNNSTNVWLIHGNSNNTFNFLVNDSGTWRNSGPSSIIPLDTWTHISGVADANGIRVYVNGILSNSSATGISTAINSNSNAELHIGKDIRFPSGGGRNLNASIDDVEIWNIARTENQISGARSCELQGNESGLVSYFKFNQGSDQANNASETTLSNSVSGATNGTLTNFALTGATSNWLAGSPVTTGSIVPGVPTVTTPVVYNQNDTATALTATTGTNGTGLLWYTVATGGTGTATAPTPSTTTVGNTSYWVSSTNANGCESERVEIVVTVNALIPATHLNFDGVNDFIELGTSIPATFNGLSTFTVEAYVYNNNVSGVAAYVGNHGTGGSTQFSLRRINDVYQILYSDSGSILALDTPSGTALSNTWQHVSATINGNLVSIYIDGVLQNTYSHTSVINFPNASGASLRIGSNDFNEIHSGNIEELRVWSTARTTNQIIGSKNCELQGNESGLVAYYKFNQGVDAADNTSITTLTDATSNGNNGILTNFALTGASSNWLAGSPVTSGSIVPSEASVTTPVMYNEGDMATPLTATTGANGSGLLWYTMATGGSGSTTAPTPSTATVGDTSYWVSSTNANGCESEREEIVVTVNAVLGIGDFITTDQITLYPNPTSNVFKIKGLNELAHLTIYNLAGKQVLSVENYNGNDVQTTNLASGMYLVAIETAASKQIIKLVIN